MPSSTVNITFSTVAAVFDGDTQAVDIGFVDYTMGKYQELLLLRTVRDETLCTWALQSYTSRSDYNRMIHSFKIFLHVVYTISLCGKTSMFDGMGYIMVSGCKI